MRIKLFVSTVIIVLLIILIELISNFAFAEDLDTGALLADVVRSRAENSAKAAGSDQSKDSIPGYSEAEKNEIESALGSIEVGAKADQLKSEGDRRRAMEVNENPYGIVSTMVEATDFKKVKGFEGYQDLKMFTRADQYMQDPIAQMSLIKA